MRDLGHGVVEDPEPDEPPVNGRPGPLAPRDLTCPWCGLHDRCGRIEHPDYSYLCGCGGLFNGTDGEWHRLRHIREEATKRRNRDPNTGKL